MSLVLGITGHRGVGKSELLKLLKQRGFFVIDADEIVADLYKNKAVPIIAEHFGKDLIRNGAVYKPALKRLIEQNPHKLSELNELVHPLVYKEVKSLIKNKDFVAIEAVYFRRGALFELIDKLIIVKRQVANSGVFSSFLEAFYNKNADTFDFVINNDGALSDLEACLVEILEQLEYKV